jgi:hypothetical protein
MIIRTQFNVEIGMSELRYRNERREYRDARDGLLKDEQKLAERTKALAAKRRQLATLHPRVAPSPRPRRKTSDPNFWPTII